MKPSLRIAVADDEQDMRDYFRTIIPMLGHEVVAVAQTGLELVEMCRVCSPDLVITDIMMPVKDGVQAATEICEEHPVPVILISGYHDPALVTRATIENVMAYLVKPIKKADLEPAIAVAMRRFEEFRVLRDEAQTLRQTLADRKVIEKAKGVLMKKARLSEPDAFRRLQKLASEKNRRLVDIANVILEAEAIFETA